MTTNKKPSDFKTRRSDALADSKRLEREFDKAADEFFNPPQFVVEKQRLLHTCNIQATSR